MMASDVPSVIGIDYGRSRTGFAVFVSGVVLPMEPLIDTTWNAIAGRVAEIQSERGTGAVVLGLPLTPSGRRTQLCDEVEALAAFLNDRGFEVELQRETGSTEEAEMQGIGNRARDGRRDSIAAMVILKRYLGMP
jgi:putative holliday junction resolvase